MNGLRESKSNAWVEDKWARLKTGNLKAIPKGRALGALAWFMTIIQLLSELLYYSSVARFVDCKERNGENYSLTRD